MKTILILITICLFIPYTQQSTIKSSSDNEHVNINITLKNQTITGGDTSEILFDFKPAKGYHVNAIPILSVKIDSNNIVASTGKLNIPSAKNKEYVDTSKPVKLPIIFRKDLKNGTHYLKGTLTYFYCSDAEGWCAKYNQPFLLKINIK